MSLSINSCSQETKNTNSASTLLSVALHRYAQLDTGKYPWNGAPQDQVAEQVDPISNSSPPVSHRRLDSVALGRAIGSLLEQARSGAGLSGANSGGNGAAAGEHDVAGLTWAMGGRQRCDIVVVHGYGALDIELLQPGKFALGPAEAVSVFVDLVPQVRWPGFGLGQAAVFVCGCCFNLEEATEAVPHLGFRRHVGDANPIPSGVKLRTLRMRITLLTRTPPRLLVLNCSANGIHAAGLR